MSVAIGVDIGGSYIKYALIDQGGIKLYQSSKLSEVKKGKDHFLNCILQCIQEAEKYAEINGYVVVGAGIGTPGIIDNRLILGGAENLPEWENLPLAGILSKSFDFPIFIDNDANLMGLGEFRFGSKVNCNDIIFLTVGTGIGGAMLINGNLYGGHRNRGAEMGHIIVNPFGEKCSCGAVGCLEAHASVTALIRDYKQFLMNSSKKITRGIDGKYIVERFKMNEKEAVDAFNLHFKYMSIGVAGFINIFSPQKVVIGGGISEAGDFYINEIRKRALGRAMKETKVFTEICSAKLGNQAGVYGASALVFSKVGSSESLSEKQ